MQLLAVANLVIASLFLVVPYNGRTIEAKSHEECNPQMVETMPDGMTSAKYGSSLRITHEVLIGMAERARETIKIASMYISFTDPPRAYHPTAEPGKRIMQALIDATKRGVKLEIVIDNSGRPMSNLDDVTALEQVGTVHRLNMTRALGKGTMHTKFMITDDENLYLGSSNFDWRSYSHVKEIGVHFEGCKTMSTDLAKIFQAYKIMASVTDAGMPEVLPAELKTAINKENPYIISQGNQKYEMYLAGSPPAVFQKPVGTEVSAPEPSGRTDDLEALLSVIDNARKFVYVSVMNYNIRSAYDWPKKYWPTIDNALRRAVIERKVRVNLLFSDWQNTREEEIIWYKDLNALQQTPLEQRTSKYPPPLGRDGGIFVKLFKVPKYDQFQVECPYSRVKHDKYVVTENNLYVGTSNWTPEYFENTCGVGFVFNRSDPHEKSSSIIEEMRKVFERDFNSEFARNV